MAPALIALLLLAPSAERRVLISDLQSDTGSAIAAQNATDAILTQLGRRPDLVVIPLPADPLEKVVVDVILEGGIQRIGSGFLALMVSIDPRTRQPISGESCRSAEENGLTACLLECAGRLLQGAEPPPVGRAGGSISISTLDGYGLREGVARNVTGVLRLELSKLGGLTVVAEKADWQVRGAIGALGATWMVSLELLDAEQKVANRVAEVFTGAQSELIEATRIAARRLVGVAVAVEGEVSVVAEVPAAQLSVDGAPPRPFSGSETLTLSPGKHTLELTAEGHHPFNDDFYVLDGQRTTLRPRISEIAAPWYENWMVWTAFGVAIAVTGTVIGVAATNRPEEALIEVRIR